MLLSNICNINVECSYLVTSRQTRPRGRALATEVHTLVGNNRYKSKLGHVAHSSRSCFPTKLIISHKLASRAFPCELSRRAHCIRGRVEALREIQPSTVHLIMRSLTRTTCTRARVYTFVCTCFCLPLLIFSLSSLSLSLSSCHDTAYATLTKRQSNRLIDRRLIRPS